MAAHPPPHIGRTASITDHSNRLLRSERVQVHAHLVDTPIPDTHFPHRLQEDVSAIDRSSVTFHGHFRNKGAAIRERHCTGVYSHLLARGSTGDRPTRFQRTNHKTSPPFITYSCTICVDVPLLVSSSNYYWSFYFFFIIS